MALPPYDRQRLKEVFAGARALPASGRQAYLAATCAGNEALRQEVESLLSSDDRAKSFLESPPVVWSDGVHPPAQLMIEGRRLGAYQVQALLGAGGMGEVYRARDTKLQRDVAVKFLPHAFTSDPDRLSRFEGEARMLAALNHPNIGAIYGFEEADGLRFLILELVEGQTLADKLADASRQRAGGSGLPIRDALSIARQIAVGLDVAHEKGIYIDPDEHGMAHYSYLSPDRRSVLVVEMTGTHAFTQPCRLVPFAGSSAGRQVGPKGTCLSAAWSPDGRWMYFGAVVGGASHLWRQRFPDGAPEQITFGPLEEEGIAVAPDGRSLVTSIGMRRSAVWIHDAAGERAIVSEGYAAAPRLSRDGTRVFYLFVRDWWLAAAGPRDAGWLTASADLRSLDLATGKSDTLLSGQSVTAYAISRDETQVAFTTTNADDVSQIWLAPLDRRTPPRLIVENGDRVSFGATGELIFRSRAQGNALARIKTDRTGFERIPTASVLDKGEVAPDGEWVIIHAPAPGDRTQVEILAVPIRGGVPRRVCDNCSTGWSQDGKFFYVTGDLKTSTSSARRTFAIPVPAGKALADFPVGGITDLKQVAALPGVRTIEEGLISPGSDPSTYVFTKTDSQRNLFRIPLH